MEYTSPVTSAAWGMDGKTIYVALKDFSIYSLSEKIVDLVMPDGVRPTYDVIDKIQPFLREEEEYIALIWGDRVMVISPDGQVINGPYKEIGRAHV